MAATMCELNINISKLNSTINQFVLPNAPTGLPADFPFPSSIPNARYLLEYSPHGDLANTNDIDITVPCLDTTISPSQQSTQNRDPNPNPQPRTSANDANVAVPRLNRRTLPPQNSQFAQDRDPNPNPGSLTSTNDVGAAVPRLDTSIPPLQNHQFAQDQDPNSHYRHYDRFSTCFDFGNNNTRDILNYLHNSLDELGKILPYMYERERLIRLMHSIFDKILDGIRRIGSKISIFSAITHHHSLYSSHVESSFRNITFITRELQSCVTKIESWGFKEKFIIGGGGYKRMLWIIRNLEDQFDEMITHMKIAQEVEERRLQDYEREAATHFRYEVLECLNRIEGGGRDRGDPSWLHLELDGSQTKG
jgi:hypothetical protein